MIMTLDHQRYLFMLCYLTILLCLATNTFSDEGSGIGPPLVNAALNKPTTQGPATFLSQAGYLESFLAVDGLLSYSNAYCTYSIRANITWWIVDLKRSRKVHSVRILTRKDPRYLLTNFFVDMFDQDPRQTAGFPENRGQVCVARVDSVPRGVFSNFDCPSVIEKRFVRIVKYATFLSLCEVQVMAEELNLTSGQAYRVIPQTVSIADVSSKTSLGLFRSAMSCAVALAADLVHTGFQFDAETGQCVMFDVSPLKGNDGLESASSWSTYMVL